MGEEDQSKCTWLPALLTALACILTADINNSIYECKNDDTKQDWLPVFWIVHRNPIQVLTVLYFNHR